MIDLKVLTSATVAGILAQLGLMVATHFITYVAQHVFLFGGMMISATCAYLYAMHTGKGYFSSATGGAIVGGVCALIGVCASVLMHDAHSTVIPWFTAISVLTGTVGGLFGQMAAKLRAMGY